jgi:hypothetical protein
MATISTAHQMGLKHSDISDRSLHAGGDMVFMSGRIDYNIHMIGGWHSNTMLQYLHLQAKPLMRQFAVTMFNHGTYYFLPKDNVPSGKYQHPPTPTNFHLTYNITTFHQQHSKTTPLLCAYPRLTPPNPKICGYWFKAACLFWAHLCGRKMHRNNVQLRGWGKRH